MEDLGQTPHPTGSQHSWRSWRSDPLFLRQIWLWCTLINYFHQHGQSWQFGWKYLRKVVLCYFCNCSFHPRTLLLHSFYFSQNSSISKALVLSCTERLMKQNDTIFNVLSTMPSYGSPVSSSIVMAWKASSKVLWWVECVTFHLAIYISWRGQPLRVSKNQFGSVLTLTVRRPSPEKQSLLNWWLLNQCERVKDIK